MGPYRSSKKGGRLLQGRAVKTRYNRNRKVFDRPTMSTGFMRHIENLVSDYLNIIRNVRECLVVTVVSVFF